VKKDIFFFKVCCFLLLPFQTVPDNEELGIFLPVLSQDCGKAEGSHQFQHLKVTQKLYLLPDDPSLC
jgi:hypothetical protein